MDDWILKLSDVKMDEGTSVDAIGMGSSVLENLGEQSSTIALIVGLIIAFALVVWVSYRWLPVDLSPARRFTLVALRVVFILLLLGILLQPVLQIDLKRQVRQTLLIMVDTSNSMDITDPRTETADIARKGIAAGKLDPDHDISNVPPNLGGELNDLSRIDLAKAVLTNEKLKLISDLQEKFDVEVFTFGASGKLAEVSLTDANASNGQTNALAWVDGLQLRHSSTAMGDSLRNVVDRKRGQPLAGMFVLTDGAHNTGAAPRTVASELSVAGLPLHFYGVGITAPRDIIITEMDAPPAAFKDDELLVSVRVNSQGLKGENAELVLEMGGKQVSSEQISFDDVTTEEVVNLRFPVEQVGEYELRASIKARPDETDNSNNAITRNLRVVDEKIKVLFVEQMPRWDYKYLHAVLSRDRRVEVKTLLLEADAAIARQEGSGYIEKFPETKTKLYDFDVIVFGDVSPTSLTRTDMENLNEFVASFGGSFVMIAGRQFSPSKFFEGDGASIGKMLPVEAADEAPSTNEDTIYNTPIKVALTSLGKIDPMLNLSEANARDNTGFWDGLDPIYWVAPVASKPGAEVLLVNPNQELGRGKVPVISRQQYGLGQVLYVGTDNTWRWRRNVGDLYYTRFWGQVNQRMAQQRFIGADKRTQITLNKQNYMTGDRVRVYARLYQAGYEALDAEEYPTVNGYYESAGGQRTEVNLKQVSGQSGLYYNEFIAPAAGQYKFFVDPNVQAGDTPAKVAFSVTETSLERSETAMNEKLLEELAGATGGKFYREENLRTLADSIATEKVTVDSRLEKELWATWLYFGLLMLVVTVEWVVRKFSFLK